MTKRTDIMIESHEKTDCPDCGTYLDETPIEEHECDGGGECGICGTEYPPGAYLDHLDDCPGADG